MSIVESYMSLISKKDFKIRIKSIQDNEKPKQVIKANISPIKSEI